MNAARIAALASPGWSPRRRCRRSAADAAFQQWLQSLRPQAEQFGISRATFDAATRDLEPDLSLPDLAIPGPPDATRPRSRNSCRRRRIMCARPRWRASPRKAARLPPSIARRWRASSATSAFRARWCWRSGARESGFGRSEEAHDAIRVLATQAYLGKRKEQFREEFLFALKMLQEGQATRAQLRSSWAGAMGMTQFLPSEFYKHAVDFDGDGKRDIWTSVPDALASAAKHLVNKGWQRRPPLGLRGAGAERARLHHRPAGTHDAARGLA